MGSTPAWVTKISGIMEKAEKVVRFYGLCNRLKDVVRSGWKVWHVERERLESVAEHVYGTQMLAIAMWSEYGYDLDLAKVIMMLAVHELEEMVIGDVIPFEASAEEKKLRGREAVVELLSGLDGDTPVRELADEFYAQKTVEARFAKECDKLEADLQCRMYDEEGCINLAKQEGNAMLMNEEVREIAHGKECASGIWLEYNRRKNNYDENFLEVSRYVEERGILDK